MNRTLTDPCELKPSDVEAHAVLDDDGNPLHPFDPEPLGSWEHALREKLRAATAALDTHTLISMGVALGVGFLVGRVLAARSS